MCMGGGGGGGGGGGEDSTAFLREQQAEANRKEKERKLRINQNIAKINDIFKGTNYAPTVKYANKLTYDPNWRAPAGQPEKPNEFFYNEEGKLRTDIGTYERNLKGVNAASLPNYGGLTAEGYIKTIDGELMPNVKVKVDENGIITEGVETGLKYTPPPAPKVEESLTTVDPELWKGKSDPKREAMFKSIHDDTMNYHIPELNRQRDVAARENKFQLARQGLTAGSVDAWTAGERDRLYQKGVQDASGLAMNAEHEARLADDKNRLSLVSRASSDEDSSSLIADALNSLGQSAAVGRAQVQAQQIVDPFLAAGSLFGNVASQMGQQAAIERLKGLVPTQNSNAPVGFANTGGNGGNNGIVYKT